MPGCDVRQRHPEQRVKAVQHVEVEIAERGPCLVAERRDVGHPLGREEQHLIRPPRGSRHERRPVLVACHQADARSDLTSDQVVEQVPAGTRRVAARLGHHPGGHRGHEREAVDLAVRVAERDTDLLAPVLEAVHLLDPSHRAQGRGPVGPRLHDGPDAARGQAGEGRVVVGGEADNLASPDGRPSRHPGRLRRSRTRRPAG